jgi:hypothetical protein
MESKPAASKEVLLLIAVGIITLIGVAFGVFKGLGQPIDGEAALRERFGATTWPLDFEVEMAHKLGSGERMVRLVRKPDSTLGDDVPNAVIVQFHRDKRTPSLMFPNQPKFAQDDEIQAYKADPSNVYRTEITRGMLPFGDLETQYIHDRLFRDTGQWVDSMRVNLSTQDVFCVVYAEFAPGVSGNEAGLARLLNGLNVSAPSPQP